MPSNYPAALDTHTPLVDNVDEVEAAHINAAYDLAIAIQTELGTDPAGSAATLKVRLAQSLADDGDLKFTASTELTIATGAVTKTQNWHTVDTEADAASDDLDTISGGAEGDVLFVRPNHTDRSVVIKHNTGNILCVGNADITLDESHDFALLIYDSTLSKWICAPMSGGGAAASIANSSISPTTSNVTAAVNTRYFADVSGLTANRNFVLPAGAVGDVIELDIKTGDDTYQLIVIGDTGISINGGSTATAWRKLWMSGDSIKLVADTTSNWQVVEDGRVHPRGFSEASNATPTIDCNNEDFRRFTALAAAMTAITISGSPIEGQVLLILITDNGTARTLPFASDADIEDGGGGLPTTTILGKKMRLILRWDSEDSKWASVGFIEEP